MDDARNLAKEGYPAGSLVVADFQHAGRGRLPARIWESSPGDGLLFTVILDVQVMEGITLRAGLGLITAIETTLKAVGTVPGNRLQLKWPNDVLVDGRKLDGILCEQSGSRVLLGMGVNIAQRYFAGSDLDKCPPTSCFLAFGSVIDRFQLLENILHTLRGSLDDLTWRSSYARKLYGIGKRVVFSLGTGNERKMGILVGVSDTGALVLEDDQGAPKEYVSGEIVGWPVETGIDGSAQAQLR